ncbi:MAG: serine/threonine protein kinase [Ardenticatenaceae bacterium]|nr:serine/threonine protein kinase [Ardenticatenaceae bacterium]MCB8988717.1 serine/threonine protein kinase [Ardenticatenaceae bacterium]
MNDPSTWSGRTLDGRYQIEERLGTGGMATVYKATDPNLKRVVAIKIIHPHLAMDPQFVRRFEEEATAVAQLRHPNIVQVYDFKGEGTTYYIVFEFVPGETLQDRLRRLNEAGRRFSPDEILKIALSISDALAYAHSRGLIHRDVKPANIMLNVYGDAILTDFGIAKIAGGTTFTATGATVGTAQYMSPEQIKGETLDGRTDIYSLGVTLFEMVSGQRPFESDSAMTLMMMHVNDPVPNLKQLRPETPPGLTAVIEKALAKDRDQRYYSAAEMHNALKLVQEAPAAPIAATVIEDPTLVEGATVVDTPATAEEATVLEEAPPPPPKPLREKPPTIQPITTGLGSGPTAAAATAGGKNRLPLFAGIGVLVLLLLIAAIVFGSRLLAGGGAETPTAVAQATPTNALPPTEVAGGIIPTATPTPIPTDTLPAATDTAVPPTYTVPPPTSTPTTEPPTATTEPPTPTTEPPTATVAALSVRITGITLDANNHYVVSYETTGYTETLPGMHVHFFFNTVSQENAGVPGSGPWILYGGPRPFTQYTAADRPAAATQMCALVANPDHSIQLNSGNCYNLP